MRKLTPDSAVSRRQFPYFVRVSLSQVGHFAHYTEICSWTKQRWGSPSRVHKDSLWACQYDHGPKGEGEMWIWFRHEEDMVLFSLTWCQGNMTDVGGEILNLGFASLNSWHRCVMRNPLADQKSFYNWLNTTDGGRYWVGVRSIYFEREEDMILFQLTWC